MVPNHKTEARFAAIFSNGWTVFAVALAIRVVLILWTGHYRNPELFENGVIAESLLQGEGFARPAVHPPRSWIDLDAEARRAALPQLPALMRPVPSSNQPPGYPFLLLFTWQAIGKTPTAYLLLSLVQALLVSSMVFPMAALTTRWFGKPAGAWAAWAACLVPPFLWLPLRLHHAALAMAAYPWLLLAWLRLAEARPGIRVAVTGIVTGIAALVQPILLGPLGLYGLWLVVRAFRRSERVAVVNLITAGLLVVAVLVPWTLRNYHAHGRFVPIKDSFGKEFWIGNNPHSTGTSVLRGGKQGIYPLLSEYIDINEAMTEMELMDRMSRLARAHIRAHPTDFALRTAKKILWFWTWVPPEYMDRLGTRAQFNHIMQLYWCGLTALFFCGIWRARGVPLECGVWLAAVFAVYSLVYGLTFVDHARFRAEIEFSCIPAAAAGVAWLAAAVFRNDSKAAAERM